jgi:hypothetical protein
VREVLDSRAFRIALAAGALGPAVLGFGFLTEAGWAVETWPFAVSHLTALFLGSILAAIAVPVIWLSSAREWATLRSSSLFPFLMAAGLAVYVVIETIGDDVSGEWGFVAAMAVGAAVALALVFAGRAVPLRDDRPTPALVRISFAVFAVILIGPGLALVLGADNVVPWSVGDQTAVSIGLIFLAAASSYVYGALRPRWAFACAPLLGFVAYDVVLLVPLVDHFSDVVPEQRLSLVIYVAAVAYSAALGIYYLLIRPETRIWSARAAPAG